MTTEQVAVLVALFVALLQMANLLLGILTRRHVEQVAAEQKRVAANLAQVASNGKELHTLLTERQQPDRNP